MRKLFGTKGWTAVWLAAALCISVTVTASAAPLWAEVVTIREPDGSSVDIKVWGDEFYSVGETLDGYTIVRDGVTGMLSYAVLSADGTELVSTGVAAGEPAPQRGLPKHIRITPEAARAQALAVREDFERRAPLGQSSRGTRGLTIGDVVGITLIVDFSDDVATIPAADIDNYCNEIGYTGYGNNGSVREYFLDVSEGLLNYTNYVPTHYFRAPNTKEYYCNPIAPYGQRARQLIQEALLEHIRPSPRGLVPALPGEIPGAHDRALGLSQGGIDQTQEARRLAGRTVDAHQGLVCLDGVLAQV